ncbi:DUF6350 family protein [Corynebacterium caspium]|uniref:cell division protein PerM n=1 Tax=Corynebacterium caspium TaxID=234828 RepID=UPI000375EC9A|nr:DUF6350 family protein [Corynebacterium caspium]WKD59638.1 hypothetical protein CCASP_06270 [Corynebacterium caspium DSM 44850]
MSPSKNTRPTRRPRKPQAVPVRQVPQKELQKPSAPAWKTYLIQMGVANLIPLLLVIVLSTATILLFGLSVAKLPATIANFWLGINLVPIIFQENQVGFLPLLPAAALFWIVSHQVYKAVKDRISLIGLSILAGYTLVIPLLITGIAWAMIADAAQVFPIATPPIYMAFCNTFLLHTGALIFGMRARLWRALARRIDWPEDLVDAARLGLHTTVAMLGAGAILWLIGIAINWQWQVQIFQQLTGFGYAATWVLSLLYAPNFAVSGAAYLLGGEIRFSYASLSVFSAQFLNLPPIPAFGALPQTAPLWIPVLVLITPLVGVAVLYKKRRGGWREAVVAGVSAGLVMAWISWLSSGNLAQIGQVGPTFWLAGILAAIWVTGLGLALVGVDKVRNR